MQCAVLDLCCVRIAVVRTQPSCLVEPLATRTIRELQQHFGIVPILLVAFNERDLSDAQAFSEFPTREYLLDLIDWNSMEPVEWGPLPLMPEPELPF